MAIVEFNVKLSLRVEPSRLWSALVDWRGHAGWIPATKVEIHSGEGGVGTEFTATSGFGALALPDRMRVSLLDAEQMRAEVEKLGPVLLGTASFALRESQPGTSLVWHERVEAKALPQALVPVAAWVGRLLFSAALLRLEYQLRSAGNN